MYILSLKILNIGTKKPQNDSSFLRFEEITLIDPFHINFPEFDLVVFIFLLSQLRLFPFF